MKVLRFLRVFAFLFGAVFLQGAFAAGYECPTSIIYTSCNAGRYLLSDGSDCPLCGANSGSSNGNSSSTCNCDQGFVNPDDRTSTVVPGGTACVPACVSDCDYGDTDTNSITGGSITYRCDETKNGISGCYTWDSGSITCNDGYFLSGGSCRPCPEGSFCSGGTQQTCPAAYPNSNPNSKSRTDCYSNNRAGSQSTCLTPSGCASSTCNGCSCTYSVYSNAAGTADGAIKSSNCGLTQTSCRQTVKSVTAPAGSRVNGLTCTACTGGTVSTGGTSTTCDECTGDKIPNTAHSTCEDCPGISHANDTHTACEQCGTGEFWDPIARQCTGCLPGSWCDGESHSCAELADGAYPNSLPDARSESDCYMSMPARKQVRERFKAAENCPTNYVNQAALVYYGQTDLCTSCDNGTQPNATGDGCTSCPAGEFYNSVADQCEACEDGTRPDEGQTMCEQCPPGKYCKDGIEYSCPPGGTSLAGSVIVQQCFKNCPTWASIHPDWNNATAQATNPKPTWGCEKIDINAASLTVNAIDEDEYAACLYDPTAKLGYYAWGNASAEPWCELREFSITYDFNGGTPIVMDVNEFDIEQLNRGEQHNLLPKPTRTGYEFLDWLNEVNDKIIKWAPPPIDAHNYSANGDDLLLYAKWTCDDGYYRDGTECTRCPPDESGVNGTSAGGEIAIAACVGNKMCQDANGGSGMQKCNYNNAGDAYTDNCTTCDLTSCGAGEYLVEHDGAPNECVPCTAGKWCPGGEEQPKDCPTGGATIGAGNGTVQDCVRACPTWASIHPDWNNATAQATNPKPTWGCEKIDINAASLTVNAIDEDEYAACLYDPTAKLGYYAWGNASAEPWCELREFSITYDFKGMTPIVMDINEFDIEQLNQNQQNELLPKPTEDGYEFLNWLKVVEGVVTDIVIGYAPPPTNVHNYDAAGGDDLSLAANWQCNTRGYFESGRCQLCPDSGTSAAGNTPKTACTLDMVCTEDRDGTLVHGLKECTFNVSTGDYTDCEATCHLTEGCPAGFYNPSAGCLICPPGSFCAGGNENPDDCVAGTYCTGGNTPTDGKRPPQSCPPHANGMQTSARNSESAEDCHIVCPIVTDIAPCTSIDLINPDGNAYYTGTQYEQCLYDATAPTGFAVNGDLGPAPTCSASDYEIEYVFYGGTPGSGTVYGYTVEDNVVLVEPSRDYSIFEGWYDNPEFTGTQIGLIPANTVTGTLKFYAKWSCGVGRYMAGGMTANACTDVTPGYYSPRGFADRFICPNGFTTAGPNSSDIDQCYMDVDAHDLDNDCDGGTRRTRLTMDDESNLTAKPTVCVNGTCTYSTQPILGKVQYLMSSDITGRAGWYYSGNLTPANLDNMCIFVESGYYSPANTANRTECPTGYSGSSDPWAVIANCYKNCPAINVAHAVSVAANPTTSYYVQGTGYAACTYDITCEQGYCRNGLQCVELLDGQICKDDGTGPENCLPTQITDRVTNTCKYCPVGKKPNATQTECICDPAQLAPGEICDGGETGYCSPMQITNPAKTQCIDCEIGTKPNTARNKCVCDPAQMAPGVVCNGDEPKECLPTQITNPSKTACMDCGSGSRPNPDQTACIDNREQCSAPNALVAYRTFNTVTGSSGICVIEQCEEGYYLSSNACLLDSRDCAVENGIGTQEYDARRGRWGECIAMSCTPGFTMEKSETHEKTKQCGQCKNKFGTLGEVAASSYTRGCEIASCMYQGEKYNLEGNECVPICDDGYEDETGVLRWNNSTKKCDRICKTGYSAW